MKPKAIDLYVALICLLAGGALVYLDWAGLWDLSRSSLLGVGALIGLALLSEALALQVSIARSTGTSSITFLPMLSCQVLFGTAPTVLLGLSVSALMELGVRRKTLKRALFNVSQWTIALFAAGWTYGALGGSPFALIPDGATVDLVGQIPAFLAFVVVLLATNHGAVSLAIALDHGETFMAVWRKRAGPVGANFLYDLLISPVAVAVAFLYLELGLIGILITLLPLFFIRHAYLITYKLEEANRNLLKALVKAIETRDPYTSGHSLRVSLLARRIAEELGISPREADAVETAALLHDIGKIDAVYTDILRKPDSLTREERAIIQSHVTKGVELLESLSSFGQDVLGAVRHHHERIDGKGYPDGLSSDEIPLGARIIKVCDAVDAMLSDRPYRKALTLDVVREQLESYAGIQFDGEIVELVCETSILEEHAADVRDERSGGVEVARTLAPSPAGGLLAEHKLISP